MAVAIPVLRGKPMSFDSYYNEMYMADGGVRTHYRALADWISGTPPDRIEQMRQAAQVLFRRVGITFAVYGEEAGAERLIPFGSTMRLAAVSQGGYRIAVSANLEPA